MISEINLVSDLGVGDRDTELCQHVLLGVEFEQTPFNTFFI